MGFAFWMSVTICVLAAALLIEIALGARRIGELRDMPPSLSGDPPKVSIIFSALNEAGTIEPALQSLLALDYPQLEIIAIDDRSTDATPDILDRMAERDARLRVLHIRELPADWLGKNHALQRGAEIATGKYLLFTDADVLFDRTTITRSVAYAEQYRLDHLTLLFEFIVKDGLLGMLATSFTIGFLSLYKPWKVAESPKHFMGIGAFNLVRADAYRACGSHAAIPLAVIDDMMLGKLLKNAGGRQHLLHGRDLVRLAWYDSAGAMIRGMEKNAYAGLDYRLSKLIVVTAAMLLLRIWPWAALFLTTGATRWINAAILLAGLTAYADILIRARWPLRSLLYAPFIATIELWMWWRATLIVIFRGGIVWRGTHYPLDALRRAHGQELLAPDVSEPVR